jgi:serine O-acetyltransferase
VSLFAQDMKRWKDRERRPAGGEPIPVTLRAGDVLTLLWRHPALWATGILRVAGWCHRHHIRLLPTLLTRANQVLFGLEFGPSIPLGPGLYIAHPSGTVVMAERIGANCSLIHAATVGMRNEPAFPALGDGVFVGAGARILGAVHLGDGSTVGANAVVIDDVPASRTAVGVPARILEDRRQVRPASYAGG